MDKNVQVTASIVEVLKDFGTKDWINWINDIVTNGVAYPISSLSAIGDVLVEIIDFLRANDITVFHYEKAVSNCFSKEYKQNIYNSELQERYLKSMIHLSSDSCNRVLVSILNSKRNSKAKGKNDYIKTLALLVLSKSPNLDKHTRFEILSYINHFGISEMLHDPFFLSTALRFSYRQVSAKAFFDTLTTILQLSPDIHEEHYSLVLHLLMDKIDELFYYKSPIFSFELREWISTSFKHDIIDIRSNILAKEVLDFICSKYNNSEYKLSRNEHLSIKYYHLELSIEILISIIANEDKSSSKYLTADDINVTNDLITLLLYQCKKKINASRLESLMFENESFIHTTKIRIILHQLNYDIDYGEESINCLKVKKRLAKIIEKTLYEGTTKQNSEGIEELISNI